MSKRPGHSKDTLLRAPFTPSILIHVVETEGWATAAAEFDRSRRNLGKYYALAKAGLLRSEPRRKPAPMPQRHYRVDWSSYGVAA